MESYRWKLENQAIGIVLAREIPPFNSLCPSRCRYNSYLPTIIMIDRSQQSGDKPNFQYDTTQLNSGGYRFKAAYDFENPDLKKELFEIKRASIDYKILDGNGRQKDIWVKNGK